MGTFHDDKGPLHGITVVVDTKGPRVWVGRCDTVLAEGVVLRDADLHEEAPGAPSKAEWLKQAARFGVWPRHPHVIVPAGEVASVRPLSAAASASD